MRHHHLRRGISAAAWLLVASLVVVSPPGPSAAAAADRSARLIRAFDLDDLSLSNPAGLAFSADTSTFHVIESSSGGPSTSIRGVSPHEEPRGLARIQAQVADPVNVTYDELNDRLLIYATPANHIVEVSSDGAGNLDPSTTRRHNVAGLGIVDPSGMAVDPATGDLWVLDLAGPSLVSVSSGEGGSFVGSETVDIGEAGLVDPASLALDPVSGHLFVASGSRPELYELTDSGELIATWDISEARLVSPGAMVFAASGDNTDDPSQLSLYIADTGIEGGSTLETQAIASTDSSIESTLRAAAADTGGDGQIVEVSLAETQEVTITATETFTAALIQEIEAFNWSPPSPDTSGVTYLPASNTLLASDGEVNEMSIYAGANMFEATLGGNLTDTWTTLDFDNNEPTGVTVNPANDHLFISRDTPPKEVFEVDPGGDGEYNTSDDTVTRFTTADFGATDPEGVSYAVTTGHLFIADGLNNEIYELSPGNNGTFDGVPPAGDDQVVRHFDILAMGMEDPEGVAFNPDTGTLYIGGKTRNIGSHNFDTVLEVTTSGALVRYIDVSAINPGRQNPKQKLSGLGYGPSSQNPGQRVLYIADRGEDNNNDPNENDGRIYEVTLPDSGGPVNSAPVAVGDSVVTSVDTPVVVDVAGNDSDTDGNLDVSSAVPVTQPSNGSAVGNGDGTITYSPGVGFVGADSFTYEICDTDGLCDTAVVDVTVTQPNDPPVAGDDSAVTVEDQGVVVDVAANDTDVDANLDVSSAVPVTQPSNGSAVGNGDGTITYTPASDFNGADSFTYEICDSLGACDTGLVGVTVSPVDDAPVAVGDSASTGVNTAVVVDVAGNDTDVDQNLDPSSAVPVTQPSNGSVVGNGDGTITYTPGTDFTGADSFTYEICDTTALCDTGTVDVTVSGDRVIYVTSTSGGTVGGVSFKDEDILAFDTSTGTWSMFFDGSDVGLGTGGQELDAFHLDTDGSILLSVGAATTLPDVGSVDDHDIVRFTPASTGENTAGSYAMFFNGEDHGLTTSGEDIDGLGFAPDGRLVVSLRGSYSVPGVSGSDVDLLAFDAGTWSLYLDGVAVGLDGGNTEDVTAAWIDSNGDVYLSVRSSFVVPGLSGDSADIFTCVPQNSSPITSCVFSMFWDGSDPANGFGGEALNGMFISG